MNTKYLLTSLTFISSIACFQTNAIAQKINQPASRVTLSATDRMFVQDAINRNNEAMALAQAALQQSQKKK